MLQLNFQPKKQEEGQKWTPQPDDRKSDQQDRRNEQSNTYKERREDNKDQQRSN